MAFASDWFKTTLLDQWFRGVPTTIPTTLYLALHTASPGPDGSGAEVSGGGYARVAIPSTTVNWAAPAPAEAAMEIASAVRHEFPAPTADWGTATDWGLWTAATGGDLVIYGALEDPRAVLNGDLAPVVPEGALAVTAG